MGSKKFLKLQAEAAPVSQFGVAAQRQQAEWIEYSEVL